MLHVTHNNYKYKTYRQIYKYIIEQFNMTFFPIHAELCLLNLDINSYLHYKYEFFLKQHRRSKSFFSAHSLSAVNVT